MTRKFAMSYWLLGLGFIVVLYVTFTRNAAPLISPSTAPTFIDEFMEDVEAHQYDESGKLKQILKVDRWQHQQGAPVAEWYQPHLTLFANNGTWYFSADRGTSSQQKLWGHIDEMHLSHNILIRHSSPQAENDWLLKTDYLLLLPQQKLAETNHLVQVEGQWMTMQSQGLKASLDQNIIEFINTVNGCYTVPDNQQKRIL